MVRAQGGTETAIRLGMRSQDFYRASGDRFPLDCGFVAQGYLMPCFSEAEVGQAHDAHRAAAQPRARRRMARRSDDLDGRDTGLAAGRHAGRVVRPRRRLHRRAAQRAGLHRGAGRHRRRRAGTLRVHRPARRRRPGRRRRHRRRARSTPSAWCSPADRNSPTVGARAGGRIHAGGTRHQVVVTAPLPDLDVHDAADGVRRDLRNLLAARRIRRPAVGHEQPRRSSRAPAVEFDWRYYQQGAGPDRGAVPGRPRPRPAPRRGPRPSTTPRTTCRSSARCSPTTGRVDGHGGRQRRRPRDDVGPGGGPGRPPT